MVSVHAACHADSLARAVAGDVPVDLAGEQRLDGRFSLGGRCARSCVCRSSPAIIGSPARIGSFVTLGSDNFNSTRSDTGTTLEIA